MSLQAPIAYCMPGETARLSDELGPIYANPPFAPLFPKEGQPAMAPARWPW